MSEFCESLVLPSLLNNESHVNVDEVAGFIVM
jgi:hypothetical protein